ncbi:D-alanine--D-alanine ligase A, partial [Myxococcota bacterium]|nr:D-alanine--D-alanine ligase A [Myxococcota bacterium]
MLAHHDLPLVRYKGIHRSEIVKPNRKAKTEALESLLSDLGPAVFVKPANMGSSIGVTRAADPKTLEDSLELAASYDEWIVVEEAVIGREIEVAVLGNRVPQVTGPG